MILQIALYVIVVGAAAAVVFTREPRAQIFVFSFFGLTLSLLFLADQAPDVALSEVVVGSAAVPLIVLTVLSRMEPR